MENNTTDIIHSGGLENLSNYKIFKRRYPSKTSIPNRTISEWYLQEIPCTTRKQSKWVCLIGTHKDTIIRTSPILSVLSKNKVCTCNCIYTLINPSKVLDHPFFGVEGQFVDGFPSNWEEIIENAINSPYSKSSHQQVFAALPECIVEDIEIEDKNKDMFNDCNFGQVEFVNEGNVLQSHSKCHTPSMNPDDNLNQANEERDDVYIKSKVEDNDKPQRNSIKNETFNSPIKTANMDLNDIIIPSKVDVNNSALKNRRTSLKNDSLTDAKTIEDINNLLSGSKKVRVTDIDLLEEFAMYDDSLMVGEKQAREIIKKPRSKNQKRLTVEEYVERNSPFKAPSRNSLSSSRERNKSIESSMVQKSDSSLILKDSVGEFFNKSCLSDCDGSISGKRSTIDNSIKGNRPSIDNSIKGNRPSIDNSITGNRPSIDNSTKESRLSVDNSTKESRLSIDSLITGNRSVINNLIAENRLSIENSITGNRSSIGNSISGKRLSIDEFITVNKSDMNSSMNRSSISDSTIVNKSINPQPMISQRDKLDDYISNSDNFSAKVSVPNFPGNNEVMIKQVLDIVNNRSFDLNNNNLGNSSSLDNQIDKSFEKVRKILHQKYSPDQAVLDIENKSICDNIVTKTENEKNSETTSKGDHLDIKVKEIGDLIAKEKDRISGEEDQIKELVHCASDNTAKIQIEEISNNVFNDDKSDHNDKLVYDEEQVDSTINQDIYSSKEQAILRKSTPSKKLKRFSNTSSPRKLSIKNPKADSICSNDSICDQDQPEDFPESLIQEVPKKASSIRISIRPSSSLSNPIQNIVQNNINDQDTSFDSFLSKKVAASNELKIKDELDDTVSGDHVPFSNVFDKCDNNDDPTVKKMRKSLCTTEYNDDSVHLNLDDTIISNLNCPNNKDKSFSLVDKEIDGVCPDNHDDSVEPISVRDDEQMQNDSMISKEDKCVIIKPSEEGNLEKFPVKMICSLETVSQSTQLSSSSKTIQKLKKKKTTLVMPKKLKSLSKKQSKK